MEPSQTTGLGGKRKATDQLTGDKARSDQPAASASGPQVKLPLTFPANHPVYDAATGRVLKDEERLASIEEHEAKCLKLREAAMSDLEGDLKLLAGCNAARELASDKIDSAMEYLVKVGYKGIADLNQLLNDNRPEFDDFEKPIPFDKLMRTAETWSAEKKLAAWKYECLYDELHRVRTLRIELRQVQFLLEKVQPANIPSFEMPIQEHRAKIQAYVKGAKRALYGVYVKLPVFTRHVKEVIRTNYDDEWKVPEKMQETWDSCDEQQREGYLRELFARGHYTFCHMRSLLLGEQWGEFRETLGRFDDGLREMQEKANLTLGGGEV